MKQTLKPLVALLALLFAAQGSISVVTAADAEEVSITGTLMALKKQNGKKIAYQPYIKSGDDSKTFIQLNIKDKNQRPNLKKYLKKRIIIKGVGQEKIIKDRTYLVFTKVTSIKKVEAAGVKEPATKPEGAVGDPELNDED